MSNYEEREQEQLTEIAALFAMNALITNGGILNRIVAEHGNDTCEAVASLSVKYAQALSAELKKLKKPKANYGTNRE